MSSDGLIATGRSLPADLRSVPADLRSVPGDLRSVDRHALDTAAISCLPSRRQEE